jgi:hypothetical protein
VTVDTPKFAVEERRRQLSSLLARSNTEVECAEELGVSQGTISNDIRALKEMSQRFIFDLAKSDLAFYYKQKLDSLDQVQREAWKLYNSHNITTKEKLLALKVIVSADESSFKLLSEGPGVLALNSLNERLTEVETAELQVQ